MLSAFKAFPVCLIVGIVLIFLSIDEACAVGEACPEYQRENKPLAAEIKADLKAYARTQGVPERLLYLYDQLADCLMCLGGDAQHPILPVIHIQYVDSSNPKKPKGLRNTKSYMTAWSADLEYSAREGMREGYVQAYYILLETSPCECCAAQTSNEYNDWNVKNDPTTSPTWDQNLGFDTALAYVHDDPDTLGEDPPDLTAIPEQEGDWEIAEVPPLRLPPPERPMTTGCDACREAVQVHNDYVIEINSWMRQLAKTVQRIGLLRNELRKVLHDIRVLGQKAQVDSVLEALERKWARYGDIVASGNDELRRLREGRRRLDEMLMQLQTLKEAVHECELICLAQQSVPQPSGGGQPALGPPIAPLDVESLIAAAEAAAEQIVNEPREAISQQADDALIQECPATRRASDAAAENEARQIIQELKVVAAQAGVPEAFLSLYENLPLCPDCLRQFARGNFLPHLVVRDPSMPVAQVWLPWHLGWLPVLFTFYTGGVPDFAVTLNFPICPCCDHKIDFDSLVLYYDDPAALVGMFPLAGFKDTQAMDSADLPNRLIGEVAGLIQLALLNAEMAKNTTLVGAGGFFAWEDEYASTRFELDAQTLMEKYGNYWFLADRLLTSLPFCSVISCEAFKRAHHVVDFDAYRRANLGDVNCVRDYHTYFYEHQQWQPPSSCRKDRLQLWADNQLSHLLQQWDRVSLAPEYTSADTQDSLTAEEYLWGFRRVNADVLATTAAQSSKHVVVAVIDSGIDLEHPKLAGQLYVNRREVPDNGRDDDKNGFVDDLYGWNFVTDNGDVRDTNGHGTMVAGIIAAQGTTHDAGSIAWGINPSAKIMALKVTNFLGRGRSEDVAAAIDYAIHAGAKIINISLGGSLHSAIEQAALARAEEAGVLVVVAAGNDNIDARGFWPAAHENVITVAATTPQDKRAPFSNYGVPVDLAAPGLDIISLRARYTDMMFFAAQNYQLGANIVGEGRQYYRSSGTSFAAPFVSGAASLLLSQRGDLDAQSLRRMLVHSALDLEPIGVDHLTGYGLLDVRQALQASSGFFIEARIAGVAIVQQDNRQFVSVQGTSGADEFKRAYLEIGSGQSPTSWTEVNVVKKPVSDDVLGLIPAQRFAGSKQWTIRLVTEHDNGRTREFRFVLNLGG